MEIKPVKITLNMPKILNKVENDSFGLFLAKEWHRLITPHTPHREGNLERLVEYQPFAITYKSEYSQYMYYGEIYVDPKYKAGGFTNDGGITWFSRKDVKKVPSGQMLNYRKNPNPYATHHWDKAAEKAGQKEKLIIMANKYLRNLG